MRWALYILLAWLFICCKKDKLEGDKSVFIGTWEWVQTVEEYNHCNPPAIQVATHTPQSTNSTYEIEFLEKGIVHFYSKGEQVDKKRIVFTEFNDFQDGYLFGIKLNRNSDDQLTGTIHGDTLLLGGWYFPDVYINDGCRMFNHIFVRK